MEGGGAVIWLYRLTTLYLSLWTQGPKSAEDRLETESTTKLNFTVQVEKCLESFNTIRNHTEPMRNNRSTETLYLTIYKQTYCRHYTDSLQCLHEFLIHEPSEDAITIVQNTLGQSWALHTNQLCDINVKKSPKQKTINSQSVRQNSYSSHTEETKTIYKLPKQQVEDFNPTLPIKSTQQTKQLSSSDSISTNIVAAQENTNDMDKFDEKGKLFFASKLSKILRDSVSDKHNEIVFKSVSATDNKKNAIVEKVIQVFKIPSTEIDRKEAVQAVNKAPIISIQE